jgi:hypothetical protein
MYVGLDMGRQLDDQGHHQVAINAASFCELGVQYCTAFRNGFLYCDDLQEEVSKYISFRRAFWASVSYA